VPRCRTSSYCGAPTGPTGVGVLFRLWTNRQSASCGPSVAKILITRWEHILS
jgi:hypothetical protein